MVAPHAAGLGGGVRMTRVHIAGFGMIPFTKPGRSEDWDVMARRPSVSR